MDMKQNAEVIRQLYREVTRIDQPPAVYRPAKSGFVPYTASSTPDCLKPLNNFFSSVGKAFPVYALKIEDLVTRKDQVMVRFKIQGTQTGNFMGLEPTRQPMVISGIDVFRLENGKVVDYKDAAYQLNALPGFNPGAGPAAPATGSDEIIVEAAGKQP